MTLREYILQQSSLPTGSTVREHILHPFLNFNMESFLVGEITDETSLEGIVTLETNLIGEVTCE